METKTIEDAVEKMATMTCKTCGGDGYTVEHDPSDPTGETPMQAQCNDCHAEGKYTTLDEVRQTLTLIADQSKRKGYELALEEVEKRIKDMPTLLVPLMSDEQDIKAVSLKRILTHIAHLKETK